MTSEADRQTRSSYCTVKQVLIIIKPERQTIYNIFRTQLKIQTSFNRRRMDEQIPDDWITIDNDFPLHVPLSESSEEYRSILEDFHELKTKHLIQKVRIERIQNRRLFRQYQVEKEYMIHQLKQDTECRLFHGCPNKPTILESIMKQGFNRSLAGKHWGK